MAWFKRNKKKTIYDVEVELKEAETKLAIYKKTFTMQSSFTDNQRRELMDFAAKVAVLELEFDHMKFKEVTE